MPLAMSRDHKDIITVTLLGTGTPFPDATRFGSAILVEAGGQRLLFDCGRGTAIRLAQLGLRPNEIDGVFLTHLHSDHITGLPDVWLTGWFLERTAPLRLWGPLGTSDMAMHLSAAYAFDIRAHEAPPESLSPASAALDAADVEPGIIYQAGSLTVTAFVVDHGSVKPAFGFRIDHEEHSVVISGDTRYSDTLIAAARGTDCLIHSVWSVGATNRTPVTQRSIASAEEAARVFAAVAPKLAVITHYENAEDLTETIRAHYSGELIVATDLLSIHVGPGVTLNRSGEDHKAPNARNHKA